MTSFSAVRECRNIYHEKKAGHTGTLDPNASGLMIVLLGKYTKLVPYCVKDHKKYHAEFENGNPNGYGRYLGDCSVPRTRTIGPSADELTMPAANLLAGSSRFRRCTVPLKKMAENFMNMPAKGRPLKENREM
jgi:hypothetical protein